MELERPDDGDWDEDEEIIQGVEGAEDEERVGTYASVWIVGENIPLGGNRARIPLDAYTRMIIFLDPSTYLHWEMTDSRKEIPTQVTSPAVPKIAALTNCLWVLFWSRRQ